MFSCARHAKTLNTNVVTLNPRYLKPYEKVRGLGFLLAFQNDLGDFSIKVRPSIFPMRFAAFFVFYEVFCSTFEGSKKIVVRFFLSFWPILGDRLGGLV